MAGMTGILFGLGLRAAAGTDPAAAGTDPAAAGDDPAAEACEAERLGFDFVSLADHPCGASPTNEAWTALCWTAARTTRIRIATRVLGVPYRPPAMVAKMAETLSRLSGGRLILGLGGGFSDEEFRAFGLGVPSPRQKVDGMVEAIEVITGLWSRPRFTFDGAVYHTAAADLEPKPARPIPIWLGTFGERALDVTGRLADGWIPSYGYVPPERLPAMRERVLGAARRAGRDPAEITCALHVQVRVDERAQPADSVVSGPPAAVAEQLAGFTRLGFTALSLTPAGPGPAEQAERLAREVMPAVPAAVS